MASGGSENIRGTMTVWLEPIFENIDWHRGEYAALERAEDDYNADLEEKEEGPLADRLSQAGDSAQQVFRILLATKPQTIEGLCALIAYVNEVDRRQSEKGHHDDGPRDLVERLRGTVEIRGVGSEYEMRRVA
jgi:hypothetical protein